MNPYSPLEGVKTSVAPVEISAKDPQKLNIETPYDHYCTSGHRLLGIVKGLCHTKELPIDPFLLLLYLK